MRKRWIVESRICNGVGGFGLGGEGFFAFRIERVLSDNREYGRLSGLNGFGGWYGG